MQVEARLAGQGSDGSGTATQGDAWTGWQVQEGNGWLRLVKDWLARLGGSGSIVDRLGGDGPERKGGARFRTVCLAEACKGRIVEVRPVLERRVMLWQVWAG